MKPRLLTIIPMVITLAGVTPAASSADFDGSLCREGTWVLEPADGQLCTVLERPYGYPDITLVSHRGAVAHKRPADARSFPGSHVLSGADAPKGSLRFNLFRDDLNQNAPAVIVQQGGSWLKYEDPLLGQFASGGKLWGDAVARYLAYRGMVAITSDSVSASQYVIKHMGLEPIVREGQRNRQTLVRLLKAEHKRFGIDPNRIYATGESAGGVEALRLALRSDDQGDIAARRLIGVDDSGVDSTITGAVATAAADCGFPGALPEKLRAGRKVFDLRRDFWKYLIAPNIAPIFSTKVATVSPALQIVGMPFYKWTNGAHDQTLDTDTDRGWGKCEPSYAKSTGDAPFALVAGATDELLPVQNALKTCAIYARPEDPRGLCDAFFAVASPNTYYGALDLGDRPPDMSKEKTWPDNLPLSEWPKNLTTWPGIGGDHWATWPPFKRGLDPVKDYDKQKSWSDEDLAIRFVWFCKHGADLPECENTRHPE